MPLASIQRVISPPLLALLVGAVLTPFAMGLSLAVFPVGGALLVYALTSGIFAYRHPHRSWQWGLWVAAGFLIANILLLTILLATALIASSGLDSIFGGGFFQATLIFGLGPAVIGGYLGGATGSLLAHKRHKLAAVLLTVLFAAAGILPFVG